MQTCRKEIKTISYIEKAYLSLCFFQLSLLTPSASLHDWQLIALPISSLFSCQVIQSCCHLRATRFPWGTWPHSAMEQSLPAPKESTTAWTQLPGDFQRGELHTHRGAEVVQTHLSPRSQRCSRVGSSAVGGTGSRMWLPLASAACRKAGMGSCKIIGTAVFINFSLLFFFYSRV